MLDTLTTPVQGRMMLQSAKMLPHIMIGEIHCVMLLSEIQNAATKASETDHLHESIVVRQCVCMRACVIVCEVETCASVWL